ncbi:uncharacterized protein LOC6552918 [Drosophila erecta]|uniref:uncharacterized protein LOC6552918 n=1 Tax=Drosophila erecta TaxID=7220 RepID=UPI000732A425|nr:uncharacterized protein LOC6552918 [Drosophila erecta]EDV49949.2 uncharacterized protein Dere_GG24475 [Drosophila erecta]
MATIRLSLLLLQALLCVHGHFQRIWGQNGPLYESTKQLIASQSSSAASIWNSTQQAIDLKLEYLQETIDTLDGHLQVVSGRLEMFLGIQYSEEWRACSKKYELQVAHFNRELLDKYSVCRNSLDHIKDHFQEEIVLEANFLSKASQEITELSSTCRIWQLKQTVFNHAGVLLCTVAGIGRINQRMISSLELCDAILLEMSLEDLDTPSCLFYHHLKMEFDEVFAQIELCAMN